MPESDAQRTTSRSRSRLEFGTREMPTADTGTFSTTGRFFPRKHRRDSGDSYEQPKCRSREPDESRGSSRSQICDNRHWRDDPSKPSSHWWQSKGRKSRQPRERRFSRNSNKWSDLESTSGHKHATDSRHPEVNSAGRDPSEFFNATSGSEISYYRNASEDYYDRDEDPGDPELRDVRVWDPSVIVHHIPFPAGQEAAAFSQESSENLKPPVEPYVYPSDSDDDEFYQSQKRCPRPPTPSRR